MHSRPRLTLPAVACARLRALAQGACGVALCIIGAASELGAQVVPDSTTRDSVRVPAVVPPPGAATVQDTVRRIARRSPVLKPPLSPRRAFLMSAILPGLAQSRLEKATSGAFFAGIEMAAIAMLRRSRNDVREVRGQPTDTVATNFRVAPGTGDRTRDGIVPPRFEPSLVRSRNLHVEDWAAAIVFNHLIAGADAFVAAQLWDVPTQVTVVPTAQGLALVASVRW